MTTNLEVANTIMAQLGGNKFRAMTGAKDILGDANSVQFKIGTGAKSGINAVRVTLDRDLYTVTFYKINRRTWTTKVVSEVAGVYSDSLRDVFTSHTGFYTSL